MMDRSRKTIAAFAVGAAAAVSLAACGDDGGSGGGSEGEIVIGVIGGFEGQFASSTGTIPLALDAWEKTVNDAGGIDGHTVKIVIKETGTATGAGLRGAQELITKEGVDVIMDWDYIGDTTWLEAAEKADVPVLVSWPGFASLISENAFQVTTGPVAQAYMPIGEMKALGDTGGIALADSGSSVGDQYVSMWETFSEQLGLELSPIAKLSDSQPDYTAFCQQLKDAGAESYAMTMTAAISDKIIRQCYDQGVTIPVVTQSGSALPSWKTEPAYEGAVIEDSLAPFFDDSIPAVKEYRDAMAEYQPDVLGSEKDNANGLAAWATMQLIATVVPTIDGDVSGKSITEALYQVEEETLGGLVGPLTFTEDGQTSGDNCYFTWGVSGGEFVSEDAEPKCVDREVLDPIEAELLEALGMA